jgi:hypothetical protein
VLAMTTAVYSYWAGARTANWAPGAFVWAILAGLVVTSALGGWGISAAIQRRWRQGDEVMPFISAWGEPDLAPPTTSAEALAEVAQLEELWRLPAKRAVTGTD